MKKQENEALDSMISFGHGYLMTMTETLRDKLSAAFAPTELVVTDDSARHEGHSGHSHGGETHFVVKIVSPAFSGMGRVERQRRVYAALETEMKTQIHALQLETKAPGE